MKYFPLNQFQIIIEEAIKSKLIDKSKIDKIKKFFKEISKLDSKKIEKIEREDYIKDIFSKEEFLGLYCFYLNKFDKTIRELFTSISYVNLDEIKIDIDDLIEKNQRIIKIVEKNSLFFLKSNKNYLVISFPLDEVLYSQLREEIGSYKPVIGYPYDVFKICQEIIARIGEKFYESLNFFTSKEIIDLLSISKPKIVEDVSKEERNNDQLVIEIHVDKIDRKVNVTTKKDKVSQVIKKKKFLIIGSPATNDYSTVKAFLDGGVKIIKLHLNMTHPVSKEKIYSYEKEKEKILKLVIDYTDVLWGLVPGNLLANRQEFEEIEYSELEAFFDFIDLFYHSFTPHYLNCNLDKMVAIDKVLEKEQLEIFNKFKIFGIEASIVSKENYGLPLTLEDLINYKSLIEKTDIPVFIPTQKKILPSDIPTIYSIGAKGLVLGQISTSFDVEQIKKTVDKFMEYSLKL